MTQTLNPVQSKEAAFQQMEIDTQNTVPSSEDIWAEKEESLTQSVNQEIHQLEHPEEYESEPVPQHQKLTENITQLLQK